MSDSSDNRYMDAGDWIFVALVVIFVGKCAAEETIETYYNERAEYERSLQTEIPHE